jgi:hypothetical protein
MKKLLFVAATALLRRWLLSQDGLGHPRIQAAPQARIDYSYLSNLASRYLLLFSLSLLFALFFVAGTVIFIHAAAQSVDTFGAFVAGAVFYTGLSLALVSALACYFSIRSIRRIVPDLDQIYSVEHAPAPSHQSGAQEFDIFRLAEPLISGLIAAWGRGRRRPSEHEAAAQGEFDQRANQRAS